jgi:hypothetical protein
MHFRIEKDHTSPVGSEFCRQGRCYKTPDAPAKADREYPVVVYLYDDDGILMFTAGCSDEEAAEHAFDYAQADVGVTYSTIAKRGEKAQPFIG